MSEGSITVKRVAELKDTLRAYVVMIDGCDRGRVRSGQHATFAVCPGEHTVVVVIGPTGSRDVTVAVAPRSEVVLQVSLAGHPLNPWREFTDDQYLKLELISEP